MAMDQSASPIPVDRSLADWEELIESAKQGDDSAMGEIVVRLNNYLNLIARREISPCLNAKFDGSDVVQHTLLKAHQKFAHFRGHSELELRAWLKQSLLRDLADFARRYRSSQARDVQRETNGDLVDSQFHHTETPSWHVRRNELDQALYAAVEQLSERERFVIHARHRYGWQYPKIAAELGVPEPHVRKIWSRAVSRLKSLIGESR